MPSPLSSVTHQIAPHSPIRTQLHSPLARRRLSQNVSGGGGERGTIAAAPKDHQRLVAIAKLNGNGTLRAETEHQPMLRYGLGPSGFSLASYRLGSISRAVASATVQKF